MSEEGGGGGIIPPPRAPTDVEGEDRVRNGARKTRGPSLKTKLTLDRLCLSSPALAAHQYRLILASGAEIVERKRRRLVDVRLDSGLGVGVLRRCVWGFRSGVNGVREGGEFYAERNGRPDDTRRSEEKTKKVEVTIERIDPPPSLSLDCISPFHMSLSEYRSIVSSAYSSSIHL